MQTYLVGGAVRDALLGRAGSDRDWVVVGSTPEAMVAAGFLPVGRDFPVFLHKKTREEYALARTERKSAPGYRGFTVHASPEVTLEEDLARRDLTINAIALPQPLADTDVAQNTGALIDPFHGQRDLQAKVLRHVTDAFREDPVRILRLARFAARFADFEVAPETMTLMRAMVADGEVDALVAERVWQELSRGLMEPTPSRMFDVLRACGALTRLLAEAQERFDAHRARVVDLAAHHGAPLAVRLAVTLRSLGAPAIAKVCERWRVPVDVRALAEVVVRECDAIDASAALDAAAIVALLERCDAFRKPDRFEDILLACALDAQVRATLQGDGYPPRARLQSSLRAALSVSTADVARQAQARGETGPAVGDAIRAARIEAVAAALARA
jgi:tRNA nucleotidyltransferase (CCA-adding enzyme)